MWQQSVSGIVQVVNSILSPGLVGIPLAGRHERLDALRGLAILWMAGFHFCFDLNYYGLIHPRQHFLSDPFWTVQRSIIVSLFLLCAGVGQALAQEACLGWPRFWRRWAQVATCALLVSVGSAQMFPRSWISFGVLHGAAVMLLLVRGLVPALERLARRWPDVNVTMWLLGVALLAWALPQGWRHAWFDSRWWNWTGLVAHLPVTEDYVPVLPWLGVMLVGVALGRWGLQHRRHWLAGPLPSPLRPLAALGRWSLSFYMLHQPVLIAGVSAWLALQAV
jgi:uncharacterized membrane protein